MTTAEKFKRRRSGLTQAQAAEAIGCPVATYRDWEQGRREPPDWISRLVLEKLSEAAIQKLLSSQNSPVLTRSEGRAES